MELKLFVGENPNDGTKGAQGAGEDVYFGTVIPDHIGDNYAFIHSCAIVGGKLIIGLDKQPTNLDITKVTIGGIDTAITWDAAKKELSGTADQKLVDLFSNIGGNTDSVGAPSVPAVVPPVHHDNPMTKPPASDVDTSADITGVTPTGTFVDFVVTQGNNSDINERGYKDPTTGASTGPFGSIDKTVIEAGVEIFGVYARIFPPGGNEPKHHLVLEVVLKAVDATVKSILVKVGGKMYDLININGSTTYEVNTTEGFDAFNNAHPTVNVGLQLKR